ncbi:hypothetical protein C0J52_10330 [Blattella germanica]|nr:hypothetical protein C0J52_10330 [Blattella germanica]
MEIKLVLLIVMSTARVAKGIECYVCGLNETDAIAAARNCKQNPGSLVATCSSESYCVSILTGDVILHPLISQGS